MIYQFKLLIVVHYVITQIPFSAGYSHSAITASDGDVYVFGSGKKVLVYTTSLKAHFRIRSWLNWD